MFDYRERRYDSMATMFVMLFVGAIIGCFKLIVFIIKKIKESIDKKKMREEILNNQHNDDLFNEEF